MCTTSAAALAPLPVRLTLLRLAIRSQAHEMLSRLRHAAERPPLDSPGTFVVPRLKRWPETVLSELREGGTGHDERACGDCTYHLAGLGSERRNLIPPKARIKFGRDRHEPSLLQNE